MWPLDSICTHPPQISSPTTLVSATGGQSCAMETCVGVSTGVPWFPEALGAEPVFVVHRTPHEKACSSSPGVDLWCRDSSCFHFFFPPAQNYLVVCCWISSARDSRVLSQHRLTESQAAPQVPASVSSGDTDGESGLATSSKLTWKILLFWENSQSFVSQGMAE